MSRKKMYRLLAFIIFTFTLLGVVVTVEFNRYTNRFAEQVNSDQSTKDLTNTPDAGQSTGEDLNSGNSTDNSGNTGAEDASVNPGGNTSEDSKDDDIPWENIELLFSGDINMTDNILNTYKKRGIDGILSRNFQEEFRNADLAMVNQEFAFTERGTKAENKQYTFRVAPENVQIFKDMQVDVVSLANNHSMDFGIEGLTDSFAALNSAGIQYAGAGNNLTEAREIKYFNIKGKKIACLGASRVIPEPTWNAYANKPGMLTTYDPTYLVEDIKTARTQSDFVVVYVHWGLEKHDTPEEYQRNLAKQYIDAGADLVVGSHPHVLQGIEYYNGKPIVYSLGNFMFYSNIKQTALLKVSINEQNEGSIRLIPGRAVESLTGELVKAEEIQKFYEYMTGISFGIQFNNDGTVIH
ncbi:CapA family protein [Anaerocolumna sp. AGMB13025]|uniref:CapA family protein n=1 Tax=Anaerocolumna sp. AGMB13025 TaxID=3039116 RepID=UPI00241D0B0E|nr:CapA family protein [Anaerocolumna sp. AGMB13025]WFR54935.1 CapA family protein [Anaerocolumna sp. AGMB13025]